MAEDNAGQPDKEVGAVVKSNVKGAFKTYGMSTMLLWIGAVLLFVGALMDVAGGAETWTIVAAVVIAAVGALPFLKQIKMKLSADISYWVVMAAAAVASYNLGNFAGDIRSIFGDVSDFLRAYGVGDSGTSVGFGVWLAMIGGLVAVLAAGMLKYKLSVKSVGDVKGLNKNQKMLLFVPALIYLAIYFIFYI